MHTDTALSCKNLHLFLLSVRDSPQTTAPVTRLEIHSEMTALDWWLESNLREHGWKLDTKGIFTTDGRKWGPKGSQHPSLLETVQKIPMRSLLRRSMERFLRAIDTALTTLSESDCSSSTSTGKPLSFRTVARMYVDHWLEHTREKKQCRGLWVHSLPSPCPWHFFQCCNTFFFPAKAT